MFDLSVPSLPFSSPRPPSACPPLLFITPCFNKYSICPFTLRNSSRAQASRSAQSSGSIRNKNGFRAAMHQVFVSFVIFCSIFRLTYTASPYSLPDAPPIPRTAPPSNCSPSLLCVHHPVAQHASPPV